MHRLVRALNRIAAYQTPFIPTPAVERYLRDARVTTLYEGTSQIQKLIIGRALTGVNALVPA